MISPTVCAATIEQLDAMRLAAYRGPYASSHAFFVTTDGPFAFVQWGIGEEGGASVYRHADRRWCMIANGGGVMEKTDLATIVGPARAERLWARSRRR